MPKMELTIENPFITKHLRPNRKPTVFKRAIARLSKEGKCPGIIVPLFVRIDEDYKVFGILTLNAGGSVSFFPDFFHLDNFDHLTINKDFIEKKGHLTKVRIDGKHKKVFHVKASDLINGYYYHIITFVMTDSDLLMDAPPEIEYTEINYKTNDQRQLYNSWLDESVSAGHCILEFPNCQGAYSIQIMILPKGKSADGLAVLRDPLEASLLHPKSLEKEIFKVRKIEIQTPDNNDFSICILMIRVPYKLKFPFGFFMAQDPEKTIPPNIIS